MVRQADLDEGYRDDGTTSHEREELRRLGRENSQLRLKREAWTSRAQGADMTHTAIPFPTLSVVLILLAVQAAVAQPPEPSEPGEKLRLWEVHAIQRYRTRGGLRNGDGGVAWHESASGASRGLFVPGPGLLRIGVDYSHTRFAFARGVRHGPLGIEPFRVAEEVWLSAQLVTPLTGTWSSQFFGAATSAFESGASSDDTFSGAGGLGVMRRFSRRLAIGIGALFQESLSDRAITGVPMVLLDWQVTDRLALTSAQEVVLSYLLDPGRRLTVAATASFYEFKQFRLDAHGALPGGVAEFRSFEVGGQLTWEPLPALTLDARVEAALGQNLRMDDRGGKEMADLVIEDALQLGLTLHYRF